MEHRADARKRVRATPQNKGYEDITLTGASYITCRPPPGNSMWQIRWGIGISTFSDCCDSSDFYLCLFFKLSDPSGVNSRLLVQTVLALEVYLLTL